MESAPRNVEVKPLSSSTMLITWEPPETPNGQVTGYKVYYTTNPNQPEASWDSQMETNDMTTISELTPHAIYTIRVQAFTSMGAGPLSNPVQVKAQQGVPSQPSNFRATDVGETAVTLQWSRPTHSGENIVHYELYWNDTYANEQHHHWFGAWMSWMSPGFQREPYFLHYLAASWSSGG
uniref:Fibronectin type-III domain-containing protein n=1 Tax=Anopheles dirus TaxID=7168 RepID=A0A182NNQ3_9DIPT